MTGAKNTSIVGRLDIRVNALAHLRGEHFGFEAFPRHENPPTDGMPTGQVDDPIGTGRSARVRNRSTVRSLAGIPGSSSSP